MARPQLRQGVAAVVVAVVAAAEPSSRDRRSTWSESMLAPLPRRLPLVALALGAALVLPPAAHSLNRRQQRTSGPASAGGAHRAPTVAAPGAPEQLKLSLAGGPDTMVVSWISKDAVPTDGSCFDRPAQVWSSDGSCADGGCSGSSPPTPFPYPLKSACALAGSEVSYALANASGGAATAASQLQTNSSLLFADHDVDANDKPTNVSTPRTVHVVVLRDLQPGASYSYKVRSAGGTWSPTYSFHTLPARSESLSLLITADVGLGGIPSSAIADAATGRFDMHLHVGDIAYDMPVNHGATGDGWSNEESNISRSIPFQAWPGNHETDDNHCDFLNYRARFYNQNLTADTATNARGVRSSNSRYYSFEIPGLLHVAGIDTDAYAEPDVDTDGNGASGQSFFVAEQWEWLKKDLESVNRTETPWLFVMGHHPMYCSSSGEGSSTGLDPAGQSLEEHSPYGSEIDPAPRLTCRTAPQIQSNTIPDWWTERYEAWKAQEAGPDPTKWCYDCSVGSAMIRNGCSHNNASTSTEVDGIPSCAVGEAPFEGLRYGLEPLLAEHKVDMYFTGHIHMYERSLPVMKSQVEQSYVNPSGVVHINTGNSGGRNGFGDGPPANFTGKRLTDVPCYTRITIRNATHLGFEQAHNGNGSVLDSFELSKVR